MTILSVERRLAAILCADVVGYSRLMGADEEGTLRDLHACRATVDELVAEHRGRVFGSAGDSVLAEFPSAVEAVRCAVAIQNRTEGEQSTVPEPRRMRLRIGITLGDVMVEGDNLMGEGVNLAARLEALAEPGSIYLSGTAFDHVEGKVDHPFEFMGEKSVKNIARPVRVYRLDPLDLPAGTAAIPGSWGRLPWRWAAVLAVAIAFLAGDALFWHTWLGWSPVEEVTFEPAPALPLPDRPSIAVLPFANMSGEAAQEYFSDGMTENLITNLSKLSGLFVIARNSTFTYKGRAVNVQDVGRELGVRYVLEGSVQRAADRVRISAQLIDATTGFHLWAEQFDREIADIFALQDEVAGSIIEALEVRLTERERRGLAQRYTQSIEAYDAYLRGRDLFARESRADLLQARALFEQAITLDPTFAPGYAQLAYSIANDLGGVTGVREGDLARALELAETALAIDDTLPLAHFVLAYVHRQMKDPAQAIASLERALELDPNYADAYAFLSTILSHAGRPDEGLEMMAEAKRLNPGFPGSYFQADAFAWFALGRYEDAIESLKKALDRNPSSVLSRVYLAASYASAGRLDEADWEVAEVLTLDPGLSIQTVEEWVPFTQPEPLQRLIDGLRQAGLPE